MKCLTCNNQGKIKLSHTKQPYCNNCFIKFIEKRVRKDLRIGQYFKPNDVVYLLNDNTKEYFVTKFFLEEIFGRNLKIREVKKSEHAKGILIVPTNLDRELKNSFEKYVSNKFDESKVAEGIIIVKLLKTVLEEEIIELCKLKNFQIRNYEPKNELIEKINKLMPETKFSMMKAFDEIKRIKKK